MSKAINAMLEASTRELRAKQFASQIFHLLRDYIPEKCWREAHEELYIAALKTDAEIITNVTREGKTLQDALDHDWFADAKVPR